MDLIRTIEEDADVENYSEDSDAEVEVSCKHNLEFFVLKIIFHFFQLFV